MRSAPQLELDNQLCFALYDASRAFVRSYGPLLAHLGLTYPQYITMLVLWEADTATSVGEIGKRLHLDSSTLTPLLKRLESLGLVVRERDADDERRVLVTLTDDARTLHERAATAPDELKPRLGISIAAATSLRDDINRLINAIDGRT